MHAHYLQHVPFEGLGRIEQWLEKAGYTTSCTRLFESAAFPPMDSIDLLIVMGGPMSVNDEDQFPWLAPEKQFVREMIRSGRLVLGICLGAQLIACAMGARVFKNREKEIGWFPIEGIVPDNDSAFSFPSSMEVFHWHGETFELPTGAIHLARSRGCENQAFQIGQTVIGLQFHLETTPASMVEIINHCRDEIIPSRYVQTESDMLSAQPDQFRKINELMDKVLSFFS
jgi:GMP synthase-like glutamine amidotransferase